MIYGAVFLQLTAALRFLATERAYARCNTPELSCVSDGGVPW
jgi:hypothetical protein